MTSLYLFANHVLLGFFPEGFFPKKGSESYFELKRFELERLVVFKMSDSNSLGDSMMHESLAAATLCLQNIGHGPDSLSGKLSYVPYQCDLIAKQGEVGDLKLRHFKRSTFKKNQTLKVTIRF